MKVKATARFNSYRFAPFAALGMTKKTFRELQRGSSCEIADKIYERYPGAFEEVKTAKKESDES